MKFFLMCIACSFIFVQSASSQYLIDSIKETTYTNKKSESIVAQNCPVHADTPLADVTRSPWEVELRNNLMDIPNNGRVQGRTENFDIQIMHNLSRVLGVYAWYGTRNTKKNDIPGSKYTADFSSQALIGGVFFYLQPTIKVFGGAGKIWLENENGDPDLETAIEKGIAFDFPVWGTYKITITYKIVEAQLKDPVIEEVSGDGGYSVGAIGLSIPLNYGQGTSD